MANIDGCLEVNGLPRNGATVKLWSAGAFGAAPQLNTPLPSGSPIASTVTGPQHGADGGYRFLNVTVGEYYVSLEWLGIIVYQYHNRPNSPWSDLKTGYGAAGDGIADDRIAIMAYLNSLVANTAASGQVELVLPPGTYRVTNTITVPNAVSNFSMSGPGYRSAIIIWDGPSGVPVFQLNSSRGVLMRDFGIIGNATASKKPSAILEINRNTNPTGGSPSPQECRFERLYLGGYSSDMCDECVLVDGSSDNDNDKHTFWECSLQGASKYGYHFKDTNALWENVIGGQILDCKIAGISNCSDNTSSGTQGGGYMCMGTRFLHCGTLFEIGESYHQIQIVNPQAESCSGFIHTPHTLQGTFSSNAPSHVLVMGGSLKLTDGGQAGYNATVFPLTATDTALHNTGITQPTFAQALVLLLKNTSAGTLAHGIETATIIGLDQNGAAATGTVVVASGSVAAGASAFAFGTSLFSSVTSIQLSDALTADWQFSVGNAIPAIHFDATNKGRLDIHGLKISSPDGFMVSFPTSGCVVNLFGGDWTAAAFTYNGNLNLHGVYENGGTVTFSNLGHGRLRFVNTGVGANSTTDLLTEFGVDPNNPCFQVKSLGTMKLQPQGKNSDTILSGSIVDISGNAQNVWSDLDTSFRIKAWGAGQVNGYFAYRPHNRDWYFTASASSNYDGATIAVTVNGKVQAVGGLGVGNSAAASTLGTVVKKMQVFDATGGSLGYVAIYDAIT